MLQSLQKYFILYKKLSLPGIGWFTLEEGSARLDFTEKKLRAPSPVINFYPQAALPNKTFFQFLSEELEVDEVQAVRHFNGLVYELRDRLNSSGVINLPGIGTLNKNETNEYSFKVDTALAQYFPDLSVERIIRQGAEHTIRVGEHERTNKQMHEMLLAEENEPKDYWWLYAILLALAGIAALIYYNYMRR